MNDQNRKEPERCEQELTTLLDPDEVAGLLRCSTKDVHGLVRAGELACVQISPRKRLFTSQHIQEYVESKTIQRRVDTKSPRPVSSGPKKGGETRRRKGTETEVSRASLIQEMSQWD
jgi:hypothetical protein